MFFEHGNLVSQGCFSGGHERDYNLQSNSICLKKVNWLITKVKSGNGYGFFTLLDRSLRACRVLVNPRFKAVL